MVATGNHKLAMFLFLLTELTHIARSEKDSTKHVLCMLSLRVDSHQALIKTGEFSVPTNRCVLFSSIPDQCTLVTDPNNPCCKVPYCDTNQPTPVPRSTVSPLPQTTRQPFVGPDGSTIAPPTMSTAVPPRSMYRASCLTLRHSV